MTTETARLPLIGDKAPDAAVAPDADAQQVTTAGGEQLGHELKGRL